MPGVASYRMVSILVASLFLGFASVCAQAQVRLDLPSQPLAQALTSLGNLANLNIYFDPAVVDGHQAPALKANISIDEALTRLLAGSQLKAIRVDENTVRVVSEATQQRAQTTREPATGAVYNPPNNVHLAYVGHASPSDSQTGMHTSTTSVSAEDSAATEADGSDRRRLDQVIVTAQKANERLQDVPVPVTALSADSLAEQNQVRLQDYFANVPGLTFSSAGHGDANLAIRGVTTGGLTNPTVGITIDDVPFGSTTALGSRTIAPDIDPSDLTRIEVLRGPQGTLYGASSMGGLLKYVTVDPSTERVSGRVEADVNGVQNGDGVGYGFRAAVNVPLGDALALRLSGFTRKDPGYINDPSLGVHGVNQADVSGGHLSVLWRPLDTLSVKLSALLQDTAGHGAAYAMPSAGLGTLDQARLPGTGQFNHQIRAYSATISADLGNGMKLVSLTGYSTDRYHGVNDLSLLFGGAGGITDILYGVTGANEPQHAATDKFSQEIRLSGSIGKQFDWLVGAFYTHENTPAYDVYNAVDTATASIAAQLLYDTYPTTYKEYAGFADLTVHFTDRFDVQFGGRESHNSQSYTETLIGPFAAFYGFSSPVTNEPVHTSDNAFTYLVTPRLRLSPDLMVYARFASGYRPGGPNPLCTLYNYSCHYDPDKTNNYELGLKGDFLEHTLSFDGSLYYIDWRDIQLQVADPNSGNTFFTNASHARSQGIELSVQSRPLRGLTVSGWLSLNDAKLTSDMPPNSPVYGVSGDRLPYSARISANLSASYDFPITGDLLGFVQGTSMYIGDRKEIFAPAQGARLSLPGYVQENLSAGIRDDGWNVSVFVNNLSDQRGLISRPLIGFTETAALYIQPRTVGLTIVRSF